MMLFKKSEPDPKLERCHVNGMNYELFMFPYQDTIQKALVVVAMLMIPIMLLGKPLVITCHRSDNDDNDNDRSSCGTGLSGNSTTPSSRAVRRRVRVIRRWPGRRRRASGTS